MTVLDAAAAERGKLRRVLGRMDTVFFLISAMVVVDTIGAIAVGGGETFTWLVVLFVTFFIPSALASAELGAALPEEGGAYVWVRRAFGRAGSSSCSFSRPLRPSSRRSRRITSPSAAAARPARGEDDVFESGIMRLIDVARPDDHANRLVR